MNLTPPPKTTPTAPLNPNYCPTCHTPPSITCSWQNHIIRCFKCGYCYSPTEHRYCTSCEDEQRNDFDQEFWRGWFVKTVLGDVDFWSWMRGLEGVVFQEIEEDWDEKFTREEREGMSGVARRKRRVREVHMSAEEEEVLDEEDARYVLERRRQLERWREIQRQRKIEYRREMKIQERREAERLREPEPEPEPGYGYETALSIFDVVEREQREGLGRDLEDDGIEMKRLNRL
ncbi:uncharacterized protein BDV14DRAFT_202286 [Aspergillus stella-maris]|uniref:uncharacterized protein n=1 Tax=Aspergillus stella-maris TaxID=1810926 RepID=UPI003CCD337E